MFAAEIKKEMNQRWIHLFFLDGLASKIIESSIFDKLWNVSLPAVKARIIFKQYIVWNALQISIQITNTVPKVVERNNLSSEVMLIEAMTQQ